MELSDNSRIFAPVETNYYFINMYKRVIYKNREDAVTAFRKMVERKREWVRQAEKELDELSLKRNLAV